MAVPELVQNGLGYTIVPGKRKTLRQVIRQLIDNPTLKLSMGLASRELAQQKFNAVAKCQKNSQILKYIAAKVT